MLNPLPIVYALEMKKTSRAPYGARGLKSLGGGRWGHTGSRAPYGARGLKFLDVHTDTTVKAVAPRMGRVD